MTVRLILQRSVAEEMEWKTLHADDPSLKSLLVENWRVVGAERKQLPDIPQDEPEQPATSPDRAVDRMRRNARRCIHEWLQRIDEQERPR